MTVNDLPQHGQQSLTLLATVVDAAVDPLHRLAALRELLTASNAAQREAVEQARAGHASWSTVAASLGVSKQAAQRRFSPKVAPGDDPVTGTGLARSPKRQPGWLVSTPGGRALLRIKKQL